jgi:hypothetical protein
MRSLNRSIIDTFRRVLARGRRAGIFPRDILRDLDLPAAGRGVAAPVRRRIR